MPYWHFSQVLLLFFSPPLHFASVILFTNLSFLVKWNLELLLHEIMNKSVCTPDTRPHCHQGYLSARFLHEQISMVSIPLQHSCLIIPQLLPFLVMSKYFQKVRNSLRKAYNSISKFPQIIQENEMFTGLLWSQHCVGTRDRVVHKTKFLASCILYSDEASRH